MDKNKNKYFQILEWKCNWIWNEMSLKDFEMQIQFCKIICSVTVCEAKFCGSIDQFLFYIDLTVHYTKILKI